MKELFNTVMDWITALVVVLVVTIIVAFFVGLMYQIHLQNAFDQASFTEQAHMFATNNLPEQSVFMKTMYLIGIK